MDNAPAKFDWIGWLTTVSGIPAGWGETLASPAPAPVVQAQADPRPRTTVRVAAPMLERKAA